MSSFTLRSCSVSRRIAQARTCSFAFASNASIRSARHVSRQKVRGRWWRTLGDAALGLMALQGDLAVGEADAAFLAVGAFVTYADVVMRRLIDAYLPVAYAGNAVDRSATQVARAELPNDAEPMAAPPRPPRPAQRRRAPAGARSRRWCRARLRCRGGSRLRQRQTG